MWTAGRPRALRGGRPGEPIGTGPTSRYVFLPRLIAPVRDLVERTFVAMVVDNGVMVAIGRAVGVGLVPVWFRCVAIIAGD